MLNMETLVFLYLFPCFSSFSLLKPNQLRSKVSRFHSETSAGLEAFILLLLKAEEVQEVSADASCQTLRNILGLIEC